MVWMLALVLVATGILMAYRHKYPYGWSHCCSAVLVLGLQEYAQMNDGRFPAGQETPEADLSLLYRSQLVYANTLRGMIVPEKTVQGILDAGGLLGPESCGWHYVSGLTLADDHGLALLWCKLPLDHNGRRSKDGGREVVYVDGSKEWISGAAWNGFLEEQKEMMGRRSKREMDGAPLVAGFVELPDGTRVDRVDAAYTLTEESRGTGSSGSGRSSGQGFTISQLVWYRAPLEDGQVIRTLSFSDLVSEPVTVVFKNGVPDATEVVFRLRRKE